MSVRGSRGSRGGRRVVGPLTPGHVTRSGNYAEELHKLEATLGWSSEFFFQVEIDRYQQ